MPISIEHALACNGWMSEGELRWLAEAASRCRLIVEIGSWAGRSACALGAHTRGVVFCVDTWERALVHANGAVIEPTLFNEFCRNTTGLPVIPVMTDSLTAAKWFLDSGVRADMIFIDANHEGPAVHADIMAWRPLLADGGTFCGHDYAFPAWPDVKTVVDELIPDADVIETIWIAPNGHK
jgi:predicted O-methyltransferase YrrM